MMHVQRFAIMFLLVLLSGCSSSPAPSPTVADEPRLQFKIRVTPDPDGSGSTVTYSCWGGTRAQNDALCQRLKEQFQRQSGIKSIAFHEPTTPSRLPYEVPPLSSHRHYAIMRAWQTPAIWTLWYGHPWRVTLPEAPQARCVRSTCQV